MPYGSFYGYMPTMSYKSDCNTSTLYNYNSPLCNTHPVQPNVDLSNYSSSTSSSTSPTSSSPSNLVSPIALKFSAPQRTSPTSSYFSNGLPNTLSPMVSNYGQAAYYSNGTEYSNLSGPYSTDWQHQRALPILPN